MQINNLRNFCFRGIARFFAMRNEVTVSRKSYKYKNRLSSRSELVIFLRPVIVSDASLEGDYAPWRSTLTRATQQPDAGAAKGETSP
jgi:hypothetical protein